MIKYTQAMLFKQAYLGDPFIHPIFFDHPQDQETYMAQTIKTQYMYGHFMVTIKGSEEGHYTYYPKGTWCTTFNYNHDPDCFTLSTGSTKSIGKKIFYFREASILPL